MSDNNYPDSLPQDYKPLGAWAYFGYTLLFTLPLVGLILAIIFSVDDEGNKHRKNFAKGMIFYTIIVWAILIIYYLFIFTVVFRTSLY